MTPETEALIARADRAMAEAKQICQKSAELRMPRREHVWQEVMVRRDYGRPRHWRFYFPLA